MAAAADLVEQLGISEILLSMETIKPSSPTPPDLRTHTLSWIDQIVVSTHVGVVLFYLQGGGGGGGDGFAGAPDYTTSERLCLLKQSLSHALSLYYVLAGRIASGTSGAFNCTDEGIDFIDARVGCPLSAVLQTTTKNPEESGTVVDLFLPCGRRCTMGAGGPLLIVKATTFSCGGMALGLCLNHTVADGQSLAFFLKTWASIARGVPDVEVSLPALDAAAAAFPLLGMLSPYPWPPADTGRPRMVRKRFVLDGSKICALREQSTNRALTRVEAVTALLWRCLIRSYSSAAAAAGVGGAAPAAAEFAACHDVGLRARMRPPLPETSFGNLFMWVAAFVACHPVDLPLIDELVTADSNSSSTTLRRLTEEQISAAIRGMDAAYIRDTLQGPERPSDFHSELGERLQRGATLTWFTSWWGFPFYEADFGWGRPTWVACGGLDNFSLESVVVLMGRRDVGGHMEAWVWSGAEEMAKLDNDPELLSLLSSDPPPHIP